MPLIEVNILEGRTDEQKEALLSAITRAVQESLNVPLSTIRVWINEMDPKHYMVAGKLKSKT